MKTKLAIKLYFLGREDKTYTPYGVTAVSFKIDDVDHCTGDIRNPYPYNEKLIFVFSDTTANGMLQESIDLNVESGGCEVREATVEVEIGRGVYGYVNVYQDAIKELFPDIEP